MHRIGADYMEDLLKLQWADVLGQSEFAREEKQARIRKLQEYYQEIVEKQQCVQISDLAVNGKDAMEVGIPKGPQIGQALTYLLEKVIEDPSLNEREYLMGELAQWKNS